MSKLFKSFFGIFFRFHPAKAASLLFFAALLEAGFFSEGRTECFIRGDVTCDGVVDAADADALADIVAGCAAPPCGPCDDAADVTDDEELTAADVVSLLAYLGGGAVPPAPFPDCGVDPTPGALDCTLEKGDMDGDGAGTPVDVTLMLLCVFLESGTCCLCVTDVTGDGLATPADVVIELLGVFTGEPLIPLPC